MESKDRNSDGPIGPPSLAQPVGKLAPESEEIERRIVSLSNRDFQLWSITLLLLLVLAAGYAALIAPNLVWKPQLIHIETRYLPQLLFGLISLVVLFNIYIIAQQRGLNSERNILVQELIFNERLEGLTLVDPLTQLWNRRALDQILSREVVRANRQGTPLTLTMIDIDEFKAINARFGTAVGDQLLQQTAQLLRAVFRGSDMLFRYGGDEFLVVMPETTEEQAERAVQRLREEVERWNLDNKMKSELSLCHGIASHMTGSSITEILQTASRKMFMKKHKMVPVF